MSSGYCWIPKVIHRRARKHRAEERPATVDKDHSNQAVAGYPESGLDEDPEVLEQDRELGAGYRQIVHPDGDPKGLEGCDLVGLAQTILMSSHAMFDLKDHRDRCGDGEELDKMLLLKSRLHQAFHTHQSHEDESIVRSRVLNNSEPRTQS